MCTCYNSVAVEFGGGVNEPASVFVSQAHVADASWRLSTYNVRVSYQVSITCGAVPVSPVPEYHWIMSKLVCLQFCNPLTHRLPCATQ